jgi:hypothetical protein
MLKLRRDCEIFYLNVTGRFMEEGKEHLQRELYGIKLNKGV